MAPSKDDQIESISDSAKRTMAHQAETIDRLRKALVRASDVAEGLFNMISPEDWRATGGDDGQGHYEGDYHAEHLWREIKKWRNA